MYLHAAIDLETLSLKTPDAMIVSIGIVAFNIEGIEPLDALDDPTRALYLFPDMEEQDNVGRHIDSDTVMWWINQGASARGTTFNENTKRYPASSIVNDINVFIAQHNIQYLWGYGSTFDNAILRGYCKSFNLPLNIHWRNDMDLRTLETIAGKKMRNLHIERGTLHDAYQDALCQAHAIQILHHNIRHQGIVRHVRT